MFENFFCVKGSIVQPERYRPARLEQHESGTL